MNNNELYCPKCEANDPFDFEYINGKYKCLNCKNIFTIKDMKDNLPIKDYIEYLKPIINDLKDGKNKLTQKDVDYLMIIIKAKIKFYEGLITKDKYERTINNTNL